MPTIDDIVVSSSLWSQAVNHLLSRERAPKNFSRDEQLLFFFASFNNRGASIRLIVREILIAQDSDLESQSGTNISPTGEFVAQALTRCRSEGWSLIEAHSHPFDSSGETTFSGIDWSNDNQKMPALAAMLPESFYHATMVVGQKSLDAHFYDRESSTIRSLRSVTVIGQALDSEPVVQSLPTTSFAVRRRAESAKYERHERQVPLIGASVQEALPKATVAVVGLGGIGSFVASELAYLGIGHLILIDNDQIEESNLNRLIGATSGDIGRDKVAVFHEIIEKISPTTRVTAIVGSVIAAAKLNEVKVADIILGCVDNHGARLMLNHLAIRYLIPYVDAGTGARFEGEGLPSSMGGQVQIVAPGMGCLECREFIDPQQAAFDLATPAEQEYEREHGYGTKEVAPSVIFLNGIVGSLQVAETVRLLSSASSKETMLVLYDAIKQSMISVQSKYSPDCATCGVDGVVGLGDLAPIGAEDSEPSLATTRDFPSTEDDNARSDTME